MKTLLLTGYDSVMAPIGELTSPLMEAYSKRHDMDFRKFTEVTPGQPAYWEKVPQIMQAFLDGYERVLWLDADQMITRPDIYYLDNMKSGFHASMDWGSDVDPTDQSQFSACGFVVCLDAWQMIHWLETVKSEWIDKPFPEQAPMRWLYKNRHTLRSPLSKMEMTTHWTHIFNSVPVQVHESVVQPWNLSRWCAHITMVDVPRRVAIFHEIQQQCLDAMLGPSTEAPSPSSTGLS